MGNKIRVLLMVVIIGLTFTNCTGVLTGHEYSKKDFVIMYKVIKGGVTVFMSKEDIEKAKLNKADIVITDSYKLIEGKDAE